MVFFLVDSPGEEKICMYVTRNLVLFFSLKEKERKKRKILKILFRLSESKEGKERGNERKKKPFYKSFNLFCFRDPYN